MLTVKAPLEIKAKTSYIRDPESFYYRILGNYSLVQTPVAKEDLLHVAATPPEIYVTEGEGISNFLSTSVRNESNYNKVQILNNVLNRIIVSADMNLTYQDRVFITDALYKLGVKDDRKFMNAFYRMAEETRNTNALINLYFDQGQNLKAMVENFSLRTEKETVSEKETLEKETKNFLYNNIFDRLSTGAVYQIVSNFNRTVDFNEIDRNEYSLSSQIYTAQNMLLNALRENAGIESKSLSLINQNTFEESVENMSEEVTDVQNQISSAVMLDILQNIYRVGFEKFITSQDLYYKFEDTFYRSSDQVIQRLISSYGTSVSRQDINEFILEENNALLQNELRLFGYSQQNELFEADVENIENLLQQISVNEKNIGNVYEDYQLRRYDTDYDIHPTEKKLLNREVLNVLQLLGESQDTETLQVMLQRIAEAQGNTESINNIISEYLGADIRESFELSATEYFKGNTEIYELLQVIASSEDNEEVANAVRKLKEQESATSNFVQIIDDYLMFFSNAEKRDVEEVEAFKPSEGALELVQLLSGIEEEELLEESLGKIKEIVKSSELQTHSIRERISEVPSLAPGKEKTSEVGLEGFEGAEAELLRILSEESQTRLSSQNIEEIKRIVKRLPDSYDSNIKQRILELVAVSQEQGQAKDSEGSPLGNSAKASLFRFLEEKNINELSEQNIEQVKNIVAQMPVSYERRVMEKVLDYVTTSWAEEKKAPEDDSVFEQEKAELIQLLSDESTESLTFENVEQIKEIIKKTALLSSKEKEKLLETVTSGQIKMLKEVETDNEAEKKARQELITILTESIEAPVSEANQERIRTILNRVEGGTEKYRFYFENEKEHLLKERRTAVETILASQEFDNILEQTIREKETAFLQEGEKAPDKGKIKKEIVKILRKESPEVLLTREPSIVQEIYNALQNNIRNFRLSFEENGEASEGGSKEEFYEQVRNLNPVPPAEVIYESIYDKEPAIENKSKLIIKRDELTKLIREYRGGEAEAGKLSDVRSIVNQIIEYSEKPEVSYIESGEIYGTGERKGEPIGETFKKSEMSPAELLYENTIREESFEESSSRFVLKKEELIKLLRERRSALIKEPVKTTDVRNIISSFIIGRERESSLDFSEGKGYEAFKPAEDVISLPNESPDESSDEIRQQESKGGNVSDEDIRRLTENINRINVENELRRQQYIEAVRNIESKKPRETATDALEKTRKRAIMALESPQELQQTLDNERIVKENREKEILRELQGIFPDQSMEIYELINRYQNNPQQLYEENILRPAEVGELLFDINNAGREQPDREEESVAKLVHEALEEPSTERVRPHAARRQEEAATNRHPAETVHKITESLSSDELNEQLEMMKHNLTRQIKEEVKSDVISEERHTNAKEIVTTDSTSQQISQVNIQRMIDNTVRSEMNSISNQVMSKIERQMRNEKIRRGY